MAGYDGYSKFNNVLAAESEGRYTATALQKNSSVTAARSPCFSAPPSTAPAWSPSRRAGALNNGKGQRHERSIDG